jgi:dephospho-CoA kinase
LRRIALTGGIATGKSHVLARFRQAGVPTVDADVIAREVVAPGTPGLAAVIDRFGHGVLAADGTLDRRRLGSIVFADPMARRDLEAIVHPAVRRAIDRFFAALPPSTPVAVADIPLLFETGRQGEFDMVVVVASSVAAQVARVMARDTLSREDAERRVRAQIPIDEKVRCADHVIRTDGTHAETDAHVDELIAQLRAEAGAV